MLQKSRQKDCEKGCAEQEEEQVVGDLYNLHGGGGDLYNLNGGGGSLYNLNGGLKLALWSFQVGALEGG